MPKSKKRLITSIVVDVCLINIAFSAAYHTCKSLGVDLLTSLMQQGEAGQLEPLEHSFVITATIVTVVRVGSVLVF